MQLWLVSNNLFLWINTLTVFILAGCLTAVSACAAGGSSGNHEYGAAYDPVNGRAMATWSYKFRRSARDITYANDKIETQDEQPGNTDQ